MESGEELFGSVYEKGSVIFHQGETGDTMYIIQSGTVEISHKQGEKETVLNMLEKGDFFGEMALFRKEPRSATVTAISRTRLLPLTRTSLLERIRLDPSVTLHLMKVLIQRIQRLDRGLNKTVEDDELLREALGGDREETTQIQQTVKQVSDKTEDEITLQDIADIWDVEQESIFLEPEQSIFLEGESGDTMYVILDGTVDITRGSGEDIWVLNHLSPGQFFGEMAIITDSPRSASASASSRTQLLPIKREDFLDRIQKRPELALYIIQSLSIRLRFLSAILADPMASIDAVRQSWHPLLTKHKTVKVSIVSLSTCAGCSAVLLDHEVLDEILNVAEINFCPMLIDQDEIPEADVALIDGVVRLKEDQEKLEEARMKSKFVVSWGTCASFGGIPAQANHFELEDLIRETYGETADTYAYYLSGRGGVEQATYQEKGVALLRKAYKIDDFVRVDYYVPGCPPSSDFLLQLLGELTGKGLKKAQPVVCGQCDRKPTKDPVTSLEAFPRGERKTECFNSLGVMCLGFLTKGGCGAVCTQHGFPCWGCRGPTKPVLNKMADGNSYEEVVTKSFSQRLKLAEDEVKSTIKLLRKQGHNLFSFDQNFISSLSRIR